MKFAGRIKINGGHVKYLDDFPGMVAQIKSNPAYEGKSGEISIDFKEEGPRYHRHKYYRGYLLPDIANEAFDGKLRLAHLEIKRMFLYKSVQSIDDIPAKHLDRSIFDFDKWTDQEGEVHRELVGYIPSTAVITDKEMADFVQKVEAFAFNDLQIGYKADSEAMVHRNASLGHDQETGELFPEIIPATGYLEG